MTHSQVPVVLGSNTIYVDEGLEHIIKALNHWGFSTRNSCRDNFGKVWIHFNSFYEVEKLYQYVLKHDPNTLFMYLIKNSTQTEVIFEGEYISDPNKEDVWVETGRLEHSVSLRFPKEDLKRFEIMITYLFPV